jgi:hypothetical protein
LSRERERLLSDGTQSQAAAESVAEEKRSSVDMRAFFRAIVVQTIPGRYRSREHSRRGTTRKGDREIMANPIPNSETPRHGMNGDRLARLAALGAVRDRTLLEDPPPAPPDLNGAADEEAQHPAPGDPTTLNGHAAVDAGDERTATDQGALRTENTELQQKVADLQRQLQESRQLEEAWNERQQQYEALLEEKSEVIREQHRKLQESHRIMADRPPGTTPRETELLALHEELEQERGQLKEDEETLMKQMRDMELQMSRERAELARQRNELQRLHTEIRHELELAARDATLRERLAPLQRRAQDALNRRGASPAANHTPPAHPAAVPPLPSSDTTKRPTESGIFRRLFGG